MREIMVDQDGHVVNAFFIGTLHGLRATARILGLPDRKIVKHGHAWRIQVHPADRVTADRYRAAMEAW